MKINVFVWVYRNNIQLLYMKLNKEWSAINEKNYQWLYNYVKTKYEDIDEFEFVDKYKRQLMSIIEKIKNWSISSIETLLFTVAKY